MRIYARQDFMKLPEGTIFAKGKPWYIFDIMIKGRTSTHDGENVDFYARSFNLAEAKDDEYGISGLDDTPSSGVSFPMQMSIGRDGSFDEEDIFLVCERQDLEKFKEFIEKAMDL